MRSLKWLFITCLLTLCILLVVVNFLLFTPAIKYLCQAVAHSNNLLIDFSNISGNLLKGEIFLTNLQLKNNKANNIKFEITINNLAVKAQLANFLSSKTIQKVTMSGVSGKINKLPINNKLNLTANSENHQNTNSKQSPQEKRFTIKQTEISDIHLLYYQNELAPIAINISNFKNELLRSNYVIFDLLFQSELTGDINGGEFLIKSKTSGNHNENAITINRLPAGFFSVPIKNLPFNLASEGDITIKILSQWEVDLHPDVVMNWIISLHNCKLSLKEYTGKHAGLMALIKQVYQNSNQKDFSINQDIALQITLNEQDLDHGFSLEKTNLEQKITEVILMNLAKGKIPLKQVIKSNLHKAADLLKDLF